MSSKCHVEQLFSSGRDAPERTVLAERSKESGKSKMKMEQVDRSAGFFVLFFLYIYIILHAAHFFTLWQICRHPPCQIRLTFYIISSSGINFIEQISICHCEQLVQVIEGFR